LETPLWIIASFGVLWCGFFWPLFRDLPTEMKGVNAAELDLIAADRSKKPAPAQALPGLISCGRPTCGLKSDVRFPGVRGNFITSLLPIYLKDHRHLSEKTTAWMSGLPLACGIVSCLLGGTLSDWLIRRLGSRTWGRRLVSCVSLALAALAILIPIWAESVPLLAFAFGAMFFFNDANLGPAWAACADVGERHAGTLSGAMNMTGSFFGAAGRHLPVLASTAAWMSSCSLPTHAPTPWRLFAGLPSMSRNRCC